MSTVLSKNVINENNTHELGLRIKNSWSKFDLKGFDQEIKENLPSQELGERIQQVRKSLYHFLPGDYGQALEILLSSLPGILEKDAFDSKLDLSSQNGFIMISLTSFVARYGLDQYQLSMDALKEMTQRFSAEGSIRFFIEKYPERTLKTFQSWVKDESPHVRRLVSEGTRPRLPMTMSLGAFKKDPGPIIPFLEILKNDPELFIRRSVANNLNDISKDNPSIVTDLLKKWNKDKSKAMQWLIKHSLRTLEKQGNNEALEILGFSNNPKIELKSFTLKNKKITLGQSLEMKLELSSTSSGEENLLIDYIIYHVKANQQLKPKVFKWSKKRLKGGEITIFKKHSFKKISTRKYYSGVHEVHIQINGKVITKDVFTLDV